MSVVVTRHQVTTVTVVTDEEKDFVVVAVIASAKQGRSGHRSLYSSHFKHGHNDAPTVLIPSPVPTSPLLEVKRKE